MTIGIDANEANIINRVGISEFAYQILTNLYNFRRKGLNSYEFRIYLKSAPGRSMPPETTWWKYVVVKPSKMWTQIGLPIKLFTESKKPDVFLTLTHYAPRISPVPTIVSVMDLSYLHYPSTFRKNDLYQLKNWTKYSVKKASRVITISKSSKDDIIKHYKVSDEKVKIVYPGLKDLPMQNDVHDLSKFGVKKEYILYVGTLQPRKNLASLIEAYSKLSESIKNKYDLVIVGKKGWLYEDILEAPKKFGVDDNVLFLDFVSDQDLPLFYKSAKLFVLPSLYEGFGLPILEAMRYGCPVITSNVSSMPEAGGDAALYFDPKKVDEIKDVIEKVLTNKDLRNKMIEKGRIHYKKFTWEKAAKEVLAAVEEVGSNLKLK